MSAFPPKIGSRNQDTAKYIIDRAKFARPSLSIIGGDSFEWPLGIEGMTISGSARIGEHFYIGDNAAVLRVMHRDDRRIEMTGMFPGVTGSENMRDILEIITAATPDNGKVLTLPGIFPKQQLVVVENYTFNHPEDDGTQSWSYTITFRRQGVGNKIKVPKIQSVVITPSTNRAKPKGKSSRVFTVHSGANTLRAVAQLVFRNPDRWREIYDLNSKQLNKLDVPLFQMPTTRLPLGMKLSY